MDKHYLTLGEKSKGGAMLHYENDDHKTVLAVSHGSACRQFMRYWAHTSDVDQKERLGNCCILKFEFENDEFKLIEIINHDFSKIS